MLAEQSWAVNAIWDCLPSMRAQLQGNESNDRSDTGAYERRNEDRGRNGRPTWRHFGVSPDTFYSAPGGLLSAGRATRPGRPEPPAPADPAAGVEPATGSGGTRTPARTFESLHTQARNPCVTNVLNEYTSLSAHLSAS